MRKVRLAKLARIVILCRKHFTRRTFECPPVLNPPLQCSNLALSKAAGSLSCKCSNSVLACRPGSTRNHCSISSNRSANGSVRVRQVCFCCISLGSRRPRRYFCAVFGSMAALAAAIPDDNFCANRIDSSDLLPVRGRCLTKMLPVQTWDERKQEAEAIEFGD